MTGLFVTLLNKRYGPSRTDVQADHREFIWNDDAERLRCILFDEMFWDNDIRRQLGPLEALYGDVRGGVLLGGCVKIAMLTGQKCFDVRRIDELQRQPEVRAANQRDPNICFFMDSANIWFYGIKDGQLYVFDSPGAELDCLGSVETAFEILLAEWEAAKTQRRHC
jgi:hypothetical protein